MKLRSLRSFLHLAPAAMGVLAGGMDFAAAEEPGVSVSPAVGMTCPTEPGKTYQVQKSADLLHWTTGPRQFGSGLPFTHWTEWAPGNAFLRVKLEDRPDTGGFAPWSPAGKSFALNSSAGTSLFAFSSATGGTRTTAASASTSFTCSARRTGENSLEITLQFSAGQSQMLRLKFQAEKTGTFESFDYVGAQLVDTDAGAFAVATAPVLGPAGAPADLAARAILFSDGGVPEVTTFASGGTGTMTEAVSSRPFTASYTVNSPQTASLAVTFGAGDYDTAELTFTSSRGGTFVRTQHRIGQLSDVDAGVFVITEAPAE